MAWKGRWSEAEALFAQAAQLMPDASLTWLSGAIACYQQSKFTEAGNAIQWALQVIPTLSTPESEAGVTYAESEDWIGVERAFRGLLAKGSPETATHLFLAIALMNLGRLPEAFDQLMAGYNLEIAGAGAATDA